MAALVFDGPSHHLLLVISVPQVYLCLCSTQGITCGIRHKGRHCFPSPPAYRPTVASVVIVPPQTAPFSRTYQWTHPPSPLRFSHATPSRENRRY
ncbi:hypothetical protein H4582DRAFT_406993 [Lactarius indigo]|nr:hypothetical protein H4582DRAFT_406993 [Lactarius indigo]